MDPDSTDTQQILADIQKAVDRGSIKLPSDRQQAPLVQELSSRTIPVIEIHVTGQVSETVLRQTADQLADGLREVDGISGVDYAFYRFFLCWSFYYTDGHGHVLGNLVWYLDVTDIATLPLCRRTRCQKAFPQDSCYG